MLFGSKNKRPLWRRAFSWLWPQSGFRRAGLYIWHRVARLPGTAHSIAAGFASGAAVSFTPFLGLHFLIGFIVAWISRGNLVASAIGTAVGNPWTFPIIFALTDHVGAFLLGQDVMDKIPVWDLDKLLHSPFEYIISFSPIVFPLFVGSIPVAIIVWIVFYFSFKGLIVRYRQARQARVEARIARQNTEKAQNNERIKNKRIKNTGDGDEQ